MKKTLTVNLNNIVFHIDDDAYEMLQVYFADVARQLSEDEKKEVMNDIEARVAELFTERLQKNKNVINIDDVQEIINVLGKPSQYTDGEEDTKEVPPTNSSEKKRSKRFYRDPENSILGGIGGGIAAYFNWDVTWIRIILVVLALISAGNMILIYLLVWIIAPEANTASQRLEMQGEEVTVENIKSEINNVKNYVESDKFKQGASNFGQRFLDILLVFFKVLVGFFGSIFGLIGIILVGALLFILMFFAFEPTFFNEFSSQYLSNSASLTPDKIIALIISLILVIGCPIFVLIYWVIRVVSGRSDYSKTTFWVLLILWVAGLFMLSSTGASSIYHLAKDSGNRIETFWIDDTETIDEVRECEDFDKIDISGNIELEFTQDTINQVLVTTSQLGMDHLVTEVVDGTLKIYSDKFHMFKDVKVKVSNDSIFELKASGASMYKTSSQFKTSNLILKLSGASRANLDMNIYNKIDIDLSGASSASLYGKAKEIKVDINGASKLDADKFESKIARVDCSGASDAKVNVSEKLNANASGASQIDCVGNPKVVRKSDNISSSIVIK